MTPSQHRLACVALVAVAACLVSGGARAADPAAGARLYREASWAGGEISGAIENGPRLPKRRLACAGCHGTEPGFAGSGEGGLDIPSLSSARLARRGLIDPSAVAAALATGELPDGTQLARSMPRFRLPSEAVADLLAYLEAPELVDAPGVTQGTVRLGLLAPVPLLTKLEPALRSWVDGLAAAGGIWGRRLVLDTLPTEPAALARRLTAAPPLAILAGAPTAGQAEILAARDVMELAPLAPLGGPSTAGGRIVALGAGLIDMATALARELARQRPGPRAMPVALVQPDQPDQRAAVMEALRPILAIQPISAEAWLRDAPVASADAILLLSRPPREALRRLPPKTLLAAPIDLVADLVAASAGPGLWLLADPRGDTLPDAPDATALQRHLTAATRLAETGLIRAGRRLTRGSFLAALATRPVDLGGRQLWQTAAADGGWPLRVSIIKVDVAAGRLERLPEPPDPIAMSLTSGEPR